MSVYSQSFVVIDPF